MGTETPREALEAGFGRELVEAGVPAETAARITPDVLDNLNRRLSDEPRTSRDDLIRRLAKDDPVTRSLEGLDDGCFWCGAHEEARVAEVRHDAGCAWIAARRYLALDLPAEVVRGGETVTHRLEAAVGDRVWLQVDSGDAGPLDGWEVVEVADDEVLLGDGPDGAGRSWFGHEDLLLESPFE